MTWTACGGIPSDRWWARSPAQRRRVERPGILAPPSLPARSRVGCNGIGHQRPRCLRRSLRRRAMNRRDAHLDAVLRHLGAAYYDSLHGKAAPADVARALDWVAGQVGEEPTGPADADVAHHGSPADQKPRGRWHRRVRDV